MSGPSGSRSPANVKPEAQQDQREPEQRREFLDGLLQFEDLVAEFQLGQVRDVQN